MRMWTVIFATVVAPLAHAQDQDVGQIGEVETADYEGELKEQAAQILSRGYDIRGAYASPTSLREVIFKLGEEGIGARISRITDVKYNKHQGNSVEDYKSQFAAKLDLSAETAFFSGSLSGSMQRELNKSRNAKFTELSQTVVLGNAYMDLANGDHRALMRDGALADICGQAAYDEGAGFADDNAGDGEDPAPRNFDFVGEQTTDLPSPYQIFDRFGTHYITDIWLGGNITYTFVYDSTEYQSSNALAAEAQLQYDGLFKGKASGSLEKSDSKNKAAQKAKFYVKFSGGDFNLATKIAGGSDQAIQDWTDTVQRSPTIVDISRGGLSPIWYLCSGKEYRARYDQLRTAFRGYLSDERGRYARCLDSRLGVVTTESITRALTKNLREIYPEGFSNRLLGEPRTGDYEIIAIDYNGPSPDELERGFTGIGDWTEGGAEMANTVQLSPDGYDQVAVTYRPASPVGNKMCFELMDGLNPTGQYLTASSPLGRMRSWGYCEKGRGSVFDLFAGSGQQVPLNSGTQTQISWDGFDPATGGEHHRDIVFGPGGEALLVPSGQTASGDLRLVKTDPRPVIAPAPVFQIPAEADISSTALEPGPQISRPDVIDLTKPDALGPGGSPTFTSPEAAVTTFNQMELETNRSIAMPPINPEAKPQARAEIGTFAVTIGDGALANGPVVGSYSGNSAGSIIRYGDVVQIVSGAGSFLQVPVDGQRAVHQPGLAAGAASTFRLVPYGNLTRSTDIELNRLLPTKRSRRLTLPLNCG